VRVVVTGASGNVGTPLLGSVTGWQVVCASSVAAHAPAPRWLPMAETWRVTGILGSWLVSPLVPRWAVGRVLLPVPVWRGLRQDQR
jgi:uncharacterized protein YbjT (DUF2867 family)